MHKKNYQKDTSYKSETMFKLAYIKLNFNTKQNAATISKIRNDLIEAQLKWPYFSIFDLIFIFWCWEIVLNAKHNFA